MSARPAPEALMQDFIAFEESAQMWSREVQGLAYWPRIRFAVFQASLLATGAQARQHGGARDRSLLARVPRPRPSRWPETLRRTTWRELGPAQLLVLPHPRYVRDGESWRCPYSGPLLEDSGYSRWTIKDRYQGGHVHPIRDGSTLYLEGALALSRLRRALRSSHTRGLDAAARADISRWGAELRAALGSGPDDARLQHMIRECVQLERVFGPVYDYLMRQTKPRAVLMVVHYSYRNLPMLHAARLQNIPVLELQHGFIGPAHAAYNTAPGRRSPLYPDYLLSFGDYWRETVPGMPLPAERVPALGYGWLDLQRARVRTQDPDQAQRTVLVISQGTVAPELARMAVRLAELIGPQGYRVRFKHHPSDLAGWRERYPVLVDSGVEVIEQATDIYEEFARSGLLVGVNSTAMYEGLPFGLELCVMQLSGHRALEPLAARGLATIFPGAEALAAHILDPQRTATRAGAPRDEVWRPGAKANFRSFLTELIGPP